MTNYTREQCIAQSLDRNMCVTANAGSGKTTVLVEKYLNIILEERLHIDPKKVVAITFTKKAASEMLTKIVKKLEDLIFAEKDFSKLKELRKIRESLTYARISTIHSFCGSILRDFPIEANISPFFFELSTAEQLSIRQNSILSTFESWLASSDDAKKIKAKQLFRELGRYRVEEIVNVLLNKRDILESIKKLYALPNEEILFKPYTLICGNINKSGRLMHELASFVYKLNIDLSDKNTSVSGFFLDDILTGLTTDELTNSDKLLRHFNALKSNLSLLFTKDGKVLDKIKKKNQLQEEQVFVLERLMDSLTNYLDYSEFINDFDLDDKAIELSRIILEITKDVNDLIEQEKQKISGLDFDDLLLKTRELLKNQYVLDKVRSNIDYLLVDEFQDTNFVQYDIIKDIIKEISENKIYPSSTQLFIVGDAKQSIYGFRNSDVRVFNQALEDIKKLNNLKLEAGIINNEFAYKGNKIPSMTEIEAQGDIKLSSTFRLQPVIASFVDVVCGNLMRNSITDFDVSYEPFVCSRNVDSVYMKEISKQSYSGNVAFLLTSNRKKEKTSEDFEAELDEAENIARFILNAIYGEKPLKIMDGEGNLRNIGFKDLAILSRKRAGFQALAQSFLKYNIPFVVHSGSGFYQTQEILDIISFLNFIHDNDDDLALMALLRSPFFNIDDINLLKISRTDGSTFWEKLKNFNIISGNQNETDKNNTDTTRAILILEKFIRISNKIPFYKLIARFLQDTAWFGTVTNKPGKKQIVANIEKFLNYARDFDSRGFKNFYDFINEIKFITEYEIDESESVFITDDDVVNIMTIHASKGLEFPVVILAGTNARSGKNEMVIVSAEYGIWFTLQKLNAEKFIESKKPPCFVIAREEKKKIEEAEEKRVLYVALTRAKDYLLISGELSFNDNGSFKKPVGFLKMILDGLNIDLQSLSDSTELNIENKLKILKDNQPVEIEHIFNVQIINNLDKLSPVIDEDIIIHSKYNYHLADIPSQEKKLIFSPTKIQNYFDDITYYRKKYILGLPFDIYDNQIFLQDYDTDEYTGMLYGTLMHRILENIHLWFDIKLNIKNDELMKLIKTSIPFNFQNNTELYNELFKECLNIVKTKLILDNIENILNGKPEYLLSIPVKDDFLNVKIDLLLKNSSGDYEIWDWKTNTINNDSDKEELIGHYEFQMKVYAYFLAKLYKQDSYISRILFTQLAGENAEETNWTHKYQWSYVELLEFEQEIMDKIDSLPRY